jgi:hypothetical protein
MAGDLGRSRMLRRCRENVALALGERADAVGDRRGGEPRVDDPPPGMHLADRVGQLIGGRVLQHESRGAALDGPPEVAGATERGQDQRPRPRQVEAELRARRDAVLPGHLDVEQRDVVIVGGGNSAGQAALHMAEHARAVTVVVRGLDLHRGMSNYLVQRINQHPRIAVRTSSQVAEARGDSHLPSVTLRSEGHDETDELAADAMFLLIGARPITIGLEGWLRRDEHGFLLTCQDVLADAPRDTWWKLSRDPYPLESSQPGVFVAGDLRHGSIKRVASAVGEGAMAASLIHRYLGLEHGP